MAKRVNKVYQHAHLLSLTTPVKAGNKVVVVEFDGGNSYPRSNGKYSTNDPEVQKALEESPRFKKDWHLLRETSLEEEEPEVEEPAGKDPEGEEEVIEGITTVQAAKDYLTKEYGATSREVSNREKVLDYAASKNVVFKDLE